MTGSDPASLLETRGQIKEMGEQVEEAGTEFNEICGSHQDYLWDIVHEKP